MLLERNCNVLFADLSLRPEAQALVEQYSTNDGTKARAVFVKTDVVQWPDLDNAFNIADKEFGGADIVCPGAGVYEPHWSNFWHPPGTEKSKDSAKPQDGIGHYAALDINLTHPIRCSQLAISRWLNPDPSAPHMKATPSNPKRIVHISSVAGQTPGFCTPIYQASKHAISGLIRSLAPLDSLGIRVNGVAPGVIKTPLWTEHPEKLKMLDTNIDAWVEPEEVADAMLRCCEDKQVVGGWVLEVLKGATRNVSTSACVCSHCLLLGGHLGRTVLLTIDTRLNGKTTQALQLRERMPVIARRRLLKCISGLLSLDGACRKKNRLEAILRSCKHTALRSDASSIESSRRW